ncbi:MAG: cupin domain-containing protein [Bacteroidota bacterium]
MEDSNRRDFVRKIGLFSGICFTGIPTAYAETRFFKNPEGIILRASEGEVWYIGNKRKAEVTIKMAKSAEYTPELSLLSEKIPPGDGIPVHKHLNEEEFLFVQKGRVEITLNDTIQEGNAGDLIYVPKSTWHGFKNTGKEEVIMLFGYSPAGFEDYFRAIGTTTVKEDLGFTAHDWKHTNQKYGVVYRNERQP